MYDDDLREVEFHEYCNKCSFENLPEYKDPCHECLGIPYNESRKPFFFKEKEKNNEFK